MQIMNSMIVSRRSPMSTQDNAIKVLSPIKSVGASNQQHARWIGGYDLLPEVPMMCPIERTNTLVDCSDPHIIAERIFHCLQKLSITATFNDASLRAETIDHTDFYIRMYKCSTQNNRQIMVEVQRSSGESFNYMKYAKVILSSANGEDDFAKDTEVKKRSSSASLSYIPGSITCHQDTSSSCKNEATLEYVKELIQKDRVDARQLGLNSLLLLTDSERSLVSETAAKAVLSEDESGDTTIKDFIYKLIDSLSPNKASSARQVDNFEQREQEIMHNTALAVLGNALESALEHSNMSQLIESKEWLGSSGIVDALLSELSLAQCHLHDAYQAARCISALLESSCEIRQVLLNRNVAVILKDAQAIGLSKHSLLAAECKEALTTLISGQENVEPSCDQSCDVAYSLFSWPCY